jgi:predicted DNA-binding transcriptional regulator YafY
LIEKDEEGSMTFEIEVVINRELFREFLGFAEGVKVISPQFFVELIAEKLQKAHEQYI